MLFWNICKRKGWFFINKIWGGGGSLLCFAVVSIVSESPKHLHACILFGLIVVLCPRCWDLHCYTRPSDWFPGDQSHQSTPLHLPSLGWGWQNAWHGFWTSDPQNHRTNPCKYIKQQFLGWIWFGMLVCLEKISFWLAFYSTVQCTVTWTLVFQKTGQLESMGWSELLLSCCFLKFNAVNFGKGGLLNTCRNEI